MYFHLDNRLSDEWYISRWQRKTYAKSSPYRNILCLDCTFGLYFWRMVYIKFQQTIRNCFQNIVLISQYDAVFVGIYLLLILLQQQHSIVRIFSRTFWMTILQLNILNGSSDCMNWKFMVFLSYWNVNMYQFWFVLLVFTQFMLLIFVQLEYSSVGRRIERWSLTGISVYILIHSTWCIIINISFKFWFVLLAFSFRM